MCMYQTIASFSACASNAITDASRSTSPFPSAGVQPRLKTTRFSGPVPVVGARSTRSFLRRLTPPVGGAAAAGGGGVGATGGVGIGGGVTGAGGGGQGGAG